MGEPRVIVEWRKVFSCPTCSWCNLGDGSGEHLCGKDHETVISLSGIPEDCPLPTPAEDHISDDFGGVWSAWCPTCGQRLMQVVRPGKVQCQFCG